MLVLAALATLALIGSLASVSDSPIGAVFPGQVALQDTPASPAAESPSASDTGPAVTTAAPPQGARTALAATAEQTAAARDTDVARWLKALTYAVIALVAVAAAGVVALVRIGSHLARVAER